jgi:hypothetical protein
MKEDRRRRKDGLGGRSDSSFILPKGDLSLKSGEVKDLGDVKVNKGDSR